MTPPRSIDTTTVSRVPRSTDVHGAISFDAVDVDPTTLQRRWGQAPTNTQPARWATSRAKRVVDIAVSAALLVPAAAVIAPLAALSAIRFRANPVFTQERTGLDGARFVVPKIRSLPTGHHAALAKHDLDERSLPRVSRLIRGCHLDELPQLWCVLRGSMSLVGPRPMIDEVLERLPHSARHQRTAVKPGLTGLWQISSMGMRPLHECPDLDVDYVEQASPRLDAWVLAQTVRVMCGSMPPSPDRMPTRTHTAR